MSYADYTYYTNTYLGTAIASADFAALALRASAFIDQITFDRAAPIVTAATDTATITKIKNAMCAVAEQMRTNNVAGNVDGIASESVGNHSVSYNANSSQQQTSTQKLIDAAGLWLSNTALLFRGFAEDEYGE